MPSGLQTVEVGQEFWLKRRPVRLACNSKELVTRDTTIAWVLDHRANAVMQHVRQRPCVTFPEEVIEIARVRDDGRAI